MLRAIFSEQRTREVRFSLRPSFSNKEHKAMDGQTSLVPPDRNYMIEQVRHFYLTEAISMLPLVRRILSDVRSERSRIGSIAKKIESEEVRRDWRQMSFLEEDLRTASKRLEDLLAETKKLGIEITPGIRCEALFPFQHRWTGPHGDGKVRSAYFVFNDAAATIQHWFFEGWPEDRRKVWPAWKNQFRNRKTIFSIPHQNV